MDVSIILCTYNRCDLLKNSLEYIGRQITSPNLKWELVVIDNNSTDSTSEVLRSARDRFPVALRFYRETKQGLSHARNRGIKEALGRYLLFTDDDTEPDPNWVETVWRTFESKSCDAVAGRIELKWVCEKPAWMTDELLGFLAHVDYGPQEQLLSSENCPPIGANMAYTASVFKKIGEFDPELGRRGERLIGGEEIDMFIRFLTSGLTAVYQPKSIVYHSVDRDRLKKSYFRSLHFNSGKVSGQRYITKGRQLLGVPLFMIPQLLRSVKTFLCAVLTRGLNGSLRLELNIWYFLGFIFGRVECAQRRGQFLR